MIIVAPDKFKGSLTAEEVCNAIKEGIHDVDTSVNVVAVPLADGGEGTCALLTKLANGDIVHTSVQDPLGKVITTSYGISADGGTAFIEMASASGLLLLEQADRNPALTSTVGTGEMILDAINRGVEQVVLGIGGSATNDCGFGMAHALGAQFCDDKGEDVFPIGGNLAKIHSIKFDRLRDTIRGVSFIILCDVSNPLHGENGAAHVFAPQKGADEEGVRLLDEGLKHIAALFQNQHGYDVNFPGAGAGGGMGVGAKVFLNGTFFLGIDYLIKSSNLEGLIPMSDLIITGEGKLDTQSLSGKVVSGVSSLCAKHNKTLWIVCGQSALLETDLRMLNANRLITLKDEVTTEDESKANAYTLIRRKVAAAIRSERPNSSGTVR